MSAAWQDKYPVSFQNQPVLKCAWIALPKILSWKISLAGSKIIFNQDRIFSRQVAAQA